MVSILRRRRLRFCSDCEVDSAVAHLASAAANGGHWIVLETLGWSSYDFTSTMNIAGLEWNAAGRKRMPHAEALPGTVFPSLCRDTLICFEKGR